MPTQTITAAGAANWTIPSDCPAGTVITTEAWGAGGGASSGASDGSGAAGGAYAEDTYTVQPADIALGYIPYVVGAGGAGTVASVPVAGGGQTVFGTYVNHLGNSSFQAAVIGTPGTLPTGYTTTLVGVTQTIVGFGQDTSTGNTLDYIDIQYDGTTTGTAM